MGFLEARESNLSYEEKGEGSASRAGIPARTSSRRF
jgi:hypothetical protein